jgi:hypothetical protein
MRQDEVSADGLFGWRSYSDAKYGTISQSGISLLPRCYESMNHKAVSRGMNLGLLRMLIQGVLAGQAF